MTHQSDLLKALEITEADLAANRDGIISIGQRRKLKGRVRAKLIPLFLFVMMMVVAALFTLQGLLGVRSMENADNYSTFGWSIMIVLAAVVIMTIRQIIREYLRESRHINAADLKTIRGPVKLNEETDDNGNKRQFVRIGSQKFRVIPPVYAAFEPKVRYTLYYTSTTNEIIGAEQQAENPS